MAGAAALVALGVRRVFAVAGTATSMAPWVAGAELAVVETETGPGAVVMAAVTGDLDGVPGVVVLEPAGHLEAAVPALRQARRDRNPLLVVVPTGRLAGAPAGGDAVRSVGDGPGLDRSSGDAERRATTRRSSDVDGRRSARPSNAAAVPNAAPGAWMLHQALAEATKGAASALLDAATLAMADPRGPVEVAVSWEELTTSGRHVRDRDDAMAGAGPRAVRADVWASASVVSGVDSTTLDDAARHVAASVRPVVLVGLESRSAQDAEWIRAFAEALPAPVVATARGRGVLPEPHPLALGVLGRNASVLDRADLVVALGVDPIELDEIDWRPMVPVLRLNRVLASDPVQTRGLAVQGDIALVLEDLAPRLRGRTRADWDVAELDRIKRALAGVGPARGTTPGTAGSATWHSRAVGAVALARELTPPGAIAVVEGRWTMAGGAWQCVTPGDLLEMRPGGHGQFAVSAAIAAALARPHVPVLAFLDDEESDGSLAELGTAHRLGLPIVIVRLGEPGAPRAARAEALGIPVISGPADWVLPRLLPDAPGHSGPALLQVH